MVDRLKKRHLIQRDVVRLRENYWSKNAKKQVSPCCSEANLVN